MMFNNTADLLKQIAIGEDSVFELKTVKFSGDKTIGLGLSYLVKIHNNAHDQENDVPYKP